MSLSPKRAVPQKQWLSPTLWLLLLTGFGFAQGAASATDRPAGSLDRVGAKTLSPLPAFPFSGRDLILGQDAADLTSLLVMAEPGDRLLIPPGNWAGGVINKTVALIGQGGSFDGGGSGTVLRVDAPGVLLEGLKIRGSGRDLSVPDCGLYLSAAARGSVLKNLEISECLFGIWIHECEEVALLHNRIHGATTGHTSNRGNGIQLFNASKLLVKGNHVTGGRDGIYVAATEDSWIEDNLTQGVRYGIHYMFSYDNSIQNNRSLDNTIGFALMQSRRLLVVNNTAKNNKDHGLLFRDAQYCRIIGNLLEDNGEGFFFFSSTENTILRNQVRTNRGGAKIWAGGSRNRIAGNDFAGNDQQIFYVGHDDLDLGVQGQGNYWSDYLGWDQDGDGIGDRAYRVNSFSSHLIYRYPASGLLLRSPALELLAHLERVLPLFRQATVVDHAPLLRSVAQDGLNNDRENSGAGVAPVKH